MPKIIFFSFYFYLFRYWPLLPQIKSIVVDFYEPLMNKIITTYHHKTAISTCLIKNFLFITPLIFRYILLYKNIFTNNRRDTRYCGYSQMFVHNMFTCLYFFWFVFSLESVLISAFKDRKTLNQCRQK